MKINNRFTGTEPSLDLQARAFDADSAGGAGRRQDVRLLREHEMEIYVNEELTMRLVCTPDHLPELVMGRLLTEGIIRDAEDVDLLYVCEFGKTARVLLREQNGGPAEAAAEPAGNADAAAEPAVHADTAAEDRYIDLTPSCCTGNQTLSGRYLRGGELPKLPACPWDEKALAELVKTAAAHFAKDTPLHRETGSTHSCFLLAGGAGKPADTAGCCCVEPGAETPQICFEAEDIGRHNAIDKVVGRALIQGIDLTQAALFISGRVPVDVAVKVIRAGIPVLISKELPTVDVVQLAREQGLTLIGRARESGFLVF